MMMQTKQLAIRIGIVAAVATSLFAVALLILKKSGTRKNDENKSHDSCEPSPDNVSPAHGDLTDIGTRDEGTAQVTTEWRNEGASNEGTLATRCCAMHLTAKYKESDSQKYSLPWRLYELNASHHRVKQSEKRWRDYYASYIDCMREVFLH
jgi:hypothetical protein